MVHVRGEAAQPRARYHLGVPVWPTSIVAGLALALLYTASPLLTITLAIATAWLAVAGRGLDRQERRRLIAVIAAALAVRFALIGAMVIGGIPLLNDLSVGALSGDDGYYLGRAIRARDLLLGVTESRYDYFVVNDEYARTSYLHLLTAAQVLFGPTPYGMRALNALIFVAAAVVLYRTIRPSFGATASFTALVVLPSLIVGSVRLVKEPVYFLVTVILFKAVLTVLRPTSATAVAAGAAIAILCVLVLDSLRRGALELSVAAVAIGLLAPVLFAAPRRAIATVALVGIVLSAAYARPAVRARAIDAVTNAAKVHAGHVFTPGHAYKLLDEGFYYLPGAPASWPITLTDAQALRFLVRAGLSFIVTPLPWEMASLSELAFFPEYLVWLMMVAFAVPGVMAGWRRAPHVTALLVGFIVPTAAALAVTTGNVGTLLRLRGLVIPFLIWFSALCALTVANYLLAWRWPMELRSEPAQ
jgi:hypothetical protein